MSSLLPSIWGGSDSNGAPLHSLHREIDKVFNEFNRSFGFPRMSARSGDAGSFFSPSMDVVENADAVEITVELPGVPEKDVEVTMVDNVLTVSGEKKSETTEEKDDYRMVERSFGSFKRSLRVPFDVPADGVDAHFADGVLKIVLPKPPEVEAKTQKIAIKSATK